ncbi:MAG TPA: hypothetical protein VGH28_20545 [Polyangiaceae bacterium]|jgi:hypothetical protein
MNRKWLLASIAGATAVLFAPEAFAQDSAQPDSSASTTNAGANAPPPKTDTGSSAGDEKITDVLENKGQSYYFLGANYRLGLVPAFMINLFVDSGPTGVLGESSVGLSFDYRKDHFSIIPGINYSSYNMDPSIFTEKGKSGVNNTTVVAANLNALYLTMDLLWSVPIAKGGQVDFEFGFAVGFGGIWGDLYNTWVSDNPAASNTTFKGQDGTTYYQCTQTPGPNGVAAGNGSLPNGCNTSNHQNSEVSKTGPNAGKGYREPMWFDSGGGSVPNILPWIELPILGLRIKPIKELEMRLQTGFSLTGFFVNFAAYFGFESPKSTPK